MSDIKSACDFALACDGSVPVVKNGKVECAVCQPGTFYKKDATPTCGQCQLGKYTDEPNLGECKAVREPCAALQVEVVKPSSSNDRICKAFDACARASCSRYSLGCINLLSGERTTRLPPVRGEVPNPRRGVQVIPSSREALLNGKLSPLPDLIDATLAYVTFTWAELQPAADDVPSFQSLQSLLGSAFENGFSVGLHISTTGTGNLPGWLAGSGVNVRNGVPDFLDCKYQDALANFVSALAADIDGHPGLEYVDITGYGELGNFEPVSSRTALQSLHEAAQRWILTMFTGGTLTRACRSGELGVVQTQVSAVGFEQTRLMLPYHGLTAFTREAAKQHSLLGLRYDQLGAPPTTPGYIPFTTLAGVIGEAWKTRPIAISLVGNVDAGDHAAGIYGRQLAMIHATYLIVVHSRAVEGGDVALLTQRLGYRIRPKMMSHSPEVAGGQALPVTLELTNEGYAPPYAPLELSVRIHQDGQPISYSVARGTTTLEPSDLLPGGLPLRVTVLLSAASIDEAVDGATYTLEVQLAMASTGALGGEAPSVQVSFDAVGRLTAPIRIVEGVEPWTPVTSDPALLATPEKLRSCEPCQAGYDGDGIICLSNDVFLLKKATCFCDAEDGWLKTLCGNTDERRCDSGDAGSETRSCSAEGVWSDPSSSCVAAPPGLCDQKCAKFSTGCSVTDGVATCGGCRFGFTGNGRQCRDIVLDMWRNEEMSRDNAADMMRDAASTARGRSLTGTDVNDLRVMLLQLAMSSDRRRFDRDTFNAWTGAIDGLLDIPWSVYLEAREEAEATGEEVAEVADIAAQVASGVRSDLSSGESFDVSTGRVRLYAARVPYMGEGFGGVEWDEGQNTSLANGTVTGASATARVRLPLGFFDALNNGTGVSGSSVGFHVVSYVNDKLFVPEGGMRSGRVQGAVIEVDVEGLVSGTVLPEADGIILSFPRPAGSAADNSDVVCSFWDFSVNQWSSKGCRVQEVTTDTVVCQCSHLTNFAVLTTGVLSSSSAHDAALSLITEVCLGISIACLVATALVYMCIPVGLIMTAETIVFVCVPFVCCCGAALPRPSSYYFFLPFWLFFPPAM